MISVNPTFLITSSRGLPSISRSTPKTFFAAGLQINTLPLASKSTKPSGIFFKSSSILCLSSLLRSSRFLSSCAIAFIFFASSPISPFSLRNSLVLKSPAVTSLEKAAISSIVLASLFVCISNTKAAMKATVSNTKKRWLSFVAVVRYISIPTSRRDNIIRYRSIAFLNRTRFIACRQKNNRRRAGS